MLSAISLISPLLSALAPKFLANLFDAERGEEYAERVKNFVDNNVTKIDTEKDVDTAIEKIREDPVVNQRLLEMLIDAERDLYEKRIADVQHARDFRASIGGSKQPTILLGLSFGLLIFIILAVIAMVIWSPFLPENGNKDIVLQLSGAAIGFLTGIGGMFARNIGSAFDFWFGSSAGSKSKTAQIDTILKKAADRPPEPPTVITVPTPEEDTPSPFLVRMRARMSEGGD